MSDFDRIFDEFLIGFGKPQRSIWNSPRLRDTSPSYWLKTDDGYKGVLKTLGVSGNNIKIDIEDYGIKVTGESEVDGVKYNTLIELPISKEIMNDVIEIKSNTINGITIVNLILDKPQKKKIKINGK